MSSKISGFTGSGLNLSNNPNLEGDSSVFLEIVNSNNKEIEINILNTKITTTQSIVASLAAKNITLVYDASQVVQ